MLSVTQNRQSVAQSNVGNAVATLKVAGRAVGSHHTESRMFGLRPMGRRRDRYSWCGSDCSTSGLPTVRTEPRTGQPLTLVKPSGTCCAKPVGGLPGPAWASLVVSRALSS